MGITPLTLGRLLDFVLGDADARPIELAARSTPELRELVLQARALLELAVEGGTGLGPRVRQRLQEVLAFGQPPPRAASLDGLVSYLRKPAARLSSESRRSRLSELEFASAGIVRIATDGRRASARLGPFEPGSAATLEIDGIATILRCAAKDAARKLVVDLSSAPLEFFADGWALWLPDGGPPRRARFSHDGLATLAWPTEPSGALRVDAAVAFVIELTIAT